MHPFIEAVKEYDALFAGWFKNMLGISTGALAILVSLLPRFRVQRVQGRPLVLQFTNDHYLW
jgi:hypothetical protein